MDTYCGREANIFQALFHFPKLGLVFGDRFFSRQAGPQVPVEKYNHYHNIPKLCYSILAIYGSYGAKSIGLSNDSEESLQV